MHVTVIPVDRFIRAGGQSANLPEWPFDDAGIHAIQWDGVNGEIEYTGQPKPPNESITDSLKLQPYIEALQTYLASQQEQEPSELPPVPQWVQFGAALAADSSVNAMVAAAATSAPVLHLMLGVGLGQAAQGDGKTFSAAWTAALQAGLVSDDLAAHVASIGNSFNLPADFLAGLNP